MLPVRQNVALPAKLAILIVLSHADMQRLQLILEGQNILTVYYMYSGNHQKVSRTSLKRVHFHGQSCHQNLPSRLKIGERCPDRDWSMHLLT